MRSGPTRDSAQRMSVVWCEGCMEAMTRAIGFGDGFENVERDAVCAVADGVEVKLKSGLVALDGQRFEFVGLHNQDSGGLGVVGIGLKHGGGAGTESAVGDHFKSASFEPRVGGA